MAKDAKTKVVSLSLEPEMHERIKDASKKLGHKNASQVVRELVAKYLELLVNEGDDIPVIIRIPASLTDNPEALKEWLRVKTEAIANAII